MLDNAIHQPFEQPGSEIFLTLSQPYNASVGLFVPLRRPKWQTPSLPFIHQKPENGTPYREIV